MFSKHLNMKKYLLFVTGGFNEDAKLAYVIDSVSNVTSSDLLKYKSLNDSIIINFATNVEFSKLNEYVNILLQRISETHFLMEYNDNMSVNLPNDESECFLNLYVKKDIIDIDTLTEELLIDEITMLGAESLKDFLKYEIIEEDQDEDILIKKSVKKEYNLDDILDKINEKGVSSLTKEENEYLKNLSK